MSEDNYNDGDNDFRIVDLDEPSSKASFFRVWRTIYNKHPNIKKWLRRGGISIAVLVCLVIFLLLPPNTYFLVE